MKNYDIAIIGGGIIGGSIAYELSKYDLSVVILEHNQYFGYETSLTNSGIIHGGFVTKINKLKGKFNMLGNSLWANEYFKKLNFPHRKINSLVIAFTEQEVLELDKLYQIGINNNIPKGSLEIIDQKTLRKEEPNISKKALKALKCSNSYLLDGAKVTECLVSAANNYGVELLTNTFVDNVSFDKNNFLLTLDKGDPISAKFVINAAGHNASDIWPQNNIKLTTRRGEYIFLDYSEYNKVKNICMLVPSIHGKGVLILPTLDHKIMVGPTAQEDVPKQDINLLDDSNVPFIKGIGKKIIPILNTNRVVRRVAGARSIHRSDNDFVIGFSKNTNQQMIHLAGIQSPGITSAPAIAKHVVEMIKKTNYFDLKPKPKVQKNKEFKII